jgi:spore maturation protein CgeB
MPEKINFNFVENQVIHPERCIEFYKETEFVLHEQVQPVILEFPVRVGEATACGSKIILFEELNLYEEAVLTKKIPELIKFSSFEDFSQKIGSLSSSKEEAVKIVENFNFTYDNALQNILRLCNNRLFSERIK